MKTLELTFENIESGFSVGQGFEGTTGYDANIGYEGKNLDEFVYLEEYGDLQEADVLYEDTFSTGIFKVNPSSLSLRTERTCSPATLSGEIPDVKDHVPRMGATVRLKVDGILVFYGRVFNTTINRWGVLNFVAYDQIRYLKNSFTNFYPSSYSVKNVITDIANHYGLKVGKLADVPNTGQSLTIDNESAFDVISKLVDVATVLTQRIIVFYDNCGELRLSYADEMVSDLLNERRAFEGITGYDAEIGYEGENLDEFVWLNEYGDLQEYTDIDWTLAYLNDVVVGDDSLAVDYELTTDIDEDTYNQIFLYRESSGAGSRVFATAQDESNVAKWGVLRLTESVEEQMNEEQMHDKADKLLEMKNRPFKTMRISALGVVGLRAGMMITIHFPSLDDEVSKKQRVVIDSIEHKFEDGVHTMDLEVRTFWRDTP